METKKNSFIRKQKLHMFKIENTHDYLKQTFSKNQYKVIYQLHKSG